MSGYAVSVTALAGLLAFFYGGWFGDAGSVDSREEFIAGVLGSGLFTICLIMGSMYLKWAFPVERKPGDYPVADGLTFGLMSMGLGLLAIMVTDSLLGRPFFCFIAVANLFYLIGFILGVFFTRPAPNADDESEKTG